MGPVRHVGKVPEADIATVSSERSAFSWLTCRRRDARQNCEPQWLNSEIRASLHGVVHTSGRQSPSQIWEDMIMRLSSGFVAPSAVAILSTALLCALGGTAVSQTAGSSTVLPSVTVVAPKQVARPPHRPEQAANTGAVRRTAPATRTPAQTATRTAPPAPGSVMAKLAQLERTSSNCTDGCQSSFKYGNQPWNGCSSTGGEFNFSATCRNVGNYKTYFECKDARLFLGARHSEAWWYCSSLLAGGKLAGEKYQVAELKRSGRR
jgi:hypothetical protein